MKPHHQDEITGDLRTLQDRLAKREATQTFMKAANKALKHHQDGALQALDLTPEEIEILKARHARTGRGYFHAHMSPGATAIRHLKRRIAELEALEPCL